MKELKYAFIKTLPIMFGYIFFGHSIFFEYEKFRI